MQHESGTPFDSAFLKEGIASGAGALCAPSQARTPMPRMSSLEITCGAWKFRVFGPARRPVLLGVRLWDGQNLRGRRGCCFECAEGAEYSGVGGRVSGSSGA